MRQLNVFIIITFMAIAWADVRSLTRDIMPQSKRGLVNSQPYAFLQAVAENANKYGKSAIYEDFDDDNEDEEEEFDDDEENMTDSALRNDDDEYAIDKPNLEDDENVDNNTEAEVENEENEEEDNNEFNNIMNMNLKLRKPYKNSNSNHQHSTTIPMPNQIIEIEGRSVIDEKTGEPALLLPRAVLDSIPNGSLVALMERYTDDESEGRANRIIIIRRRIPKRPKPVVKRGGNNRRNNSQRKNEHVIRRGGGNGNRRRVNVRHIYI